MDVTFIAEELGYTFPSHWTVEVTEDSDYETSPNEFDCYSDADVKAWTDLDWSFVMLIVRVLDGNANVWGMGVLGGIESGYMGHGYADPISDVLQNEYDDMIIEACDNAKDEINRWLRQFPDGPVF